MCVQGGGEFGKSSCLLVFRTIFCFQVSILNPWCQKGSKNCQIPSQTYNKCDIDGLDDTDMEFYSTGLGSDKKFILS